MASFFSPADSGKQDQAAFMGALLQTQMTQAAQNSLQGGADKESGYLTSGVGSARDVLNQNFAPALAALNSGYDAARGDVSTNYGLGQGHIQQGTNPYQPGNPPGTTANNTLIGALGIG